MADESLLLTQGELKSLLAYDSATGVFIWNIAKSPAVKVGGIAGCLDAEGYRVIRIDGRNYKAHRLAWLYVYGSWPTKDLDHENGRKDDNRIMNLREATVRENHYNRGKPRTNTSGFKGVSWYRRTQRWRAQIRANGKRLHLGEFIELEEAVQAYAVATQKYHGKFVHV